MSTWRLQLNSETENKYRWTTEVDAVAFKLYIPKVVVPTPAPQAISVDVEYGPDLARHAPRLNGDQGIVAQAEFVAEHTQTVHYIPSGDPKTWTIGEPYVPMSILPKPWPTSLRIVVRWGQSGN